MHAPFLPAEQVNLLDPIPPAVSNSVQRPEVLEANMGGEVGETVPTEVILDRGQDQSTEGVRAASEIEVTRVKQDAGL